MRINIIRAGRAMRATERVKKTETGTAKRCPGSRAVQGGDPFGGDQFAVIRRRGSSLERRHRHPVGSAPTD